MLKNRQLLLIIILTFGFSNQWIEINSNSPKSPTIELISSDVENSIISFELHGFYFKPIQIDEVEYSVVKIPTAASIMNEGSPDLPKMSTSIIIPDDKNMDIEVISSNYIEYENINIAPSKGNLSRLINPENVPYTFNDSYDENKFYPNNIAQLNEPYILRDFRGQVVEFHPVQYNPMTHTLRVYTSIKISAQSSDGNSVNPFNREDSLEKVDKEYKNIYESQFINFNNDTRFEYLVDHGNMLIISYGDFMDEMQPLVDWKNMKGIPTEMVNVSTVGSNSTSISNYVADYYNDNGLTFLLLVGDIAQIPSPLVSGSASDMSYGCINGNDFYQEVIVGRISASNPSQVSTQVERSVEYERYPQITGDWHDNALGVASNQGPGYNGMMDDEFSQYLWDAVLSDFTYDDYQGIYDPTGSDSQGITAINNGVSIINYTGHGSISSWGNGASLNTTQINQLTNNNKLPFVITVGCNVGEFNSTNECFAEAWQRATNGGEPTGGIAHFGSTISQSWTPPMHGQYAMNLIITESYDEHLTRTLGGITTNGCMYMNDAQGSSGINETKYWTFFGDPSVNIRTATPSNLNVSYDDVILVGQSEFVVDIGENGALAALSQDGVLLSSAYSDGGVAVLQLGDAATVPGSLDLVVTGFNSYPHESEVMIIAPEGAYLVIDDVVVEYGLVDSGHLLYGWDNHLNLTVSNVGSDAATDITISMDTESQYAEIIQGIVTYDNIDSNQSVEIGGLNVQLDWNIPNGQLINIVFQIATDDDTIEVEIPFVVQSPTISFNSINGSLNPGETSDLNISLSNIGDAAINYPIVSAEGDMYVTVNGSGIGNAYYWDFLQGNNQEVLLANVTVSPSAPIGHVAEITVHVTNLDGGLNTSFLVYLAVGQITENFESGFTDALNWTFSGNADWEITTTDQYEGFYSAQSGDIDHSQTSQMSVTMEVGIIGGYIEFYYRVASEYSPSGDNFYDGLEFYIDNQMVGQYQPLGGETSWTQASHFVQSGMHTFTWKYVKDGGPGATDMEEDCAWVDYISFPPSMLEDSGIFGDINGDGTVSVIDVVQVINMILGGSDIDSAADLNDDGNVDVLDVIIMVNIILGT